jgi:hypothetical protein
MCRRYVRTEILLFIMLVLGTGIVSSVHGRVVG